MYRGTLLRVRSELSRAGFSLVELLVVVVIIVAIAAIAIPLFLNQKDKADEGRLTSDATAVGRLVLVAVSTGSPVYYSDGTLYTEESSPSGYQSVTVDGTFSADFPSGAIPSAGDCVAISSVSAISYCVPDEDGAGGGVQPGDAVAPLPLQLSYASSSFLRGSNNSLVSPTVSGGSGGVTYSLSGSLPPSVSFDSNTGVFTGPASASWTFPQLTISTSIPGYSTFAATPDGGVIVTGTIYAASSFGSTTLTPAGSGDLYVAKMNKGGGWEWAKLAGLSSPLSPLFVAVGADGSIAVQGAFSGTVTLGSDTITSTGGVANMFVMRFASNGNATWLRAATSTGASGNIHSAGIAITTEGDVVATARQDAMGINFAGVSLPNAGWSSVAIGSYRSDGTGKWAVQQGGPDMMLPGFPPNSGIPSIAATIDGGVVIGSTRRLTPVLTVAGATIPGVTLSGTTSPVLVKLSPTGSLEWGYSLDSHGCDPNSCSVGATAQGGVAVDTLGNIFFGVWGHGSTYTMAWGATTVTSNFAWNRLFVAKTANDGTPLWAALVPSNSSSHTLTGIAPTQDGGAVVMGQHTAQTISAAGVSSGALTSYAYQDRRLSASPDGSHYLSNYHAWLPGLQLVRANSARVRETGLAPGSFPSAVTVTATDSLGATVSVPVTISVSP